MSLLAKPDSPAEQLAERFSWRDGFQPGSKPGVALPCKMHRRVSDGSKSSSIIRLKSSNNLRGEANCVKPEHQCASYTGNVKPDPAFKGEPLGMQCTEQALPVVDGRLESALIRLKLKPPIRDHYAKVNHLVGTWDDKRRTGDA